MEKLIEKMHKSSILNKWFGVIYGIYLTTISVLENHVYGYSLMMVSVILWIADSMYLALERRFISGERKNLLKAMFSFSELLYLTLFILAIFDVLV